MNLKPHQQVTIYVDPIVQQIPEGLAELIRKEKDGPKDSEFWTVRFVGEREELGRWIYPENRARPDCACG